MAFDKEQLQQLDEILTRKLAEQRVQSDKQHADVMHEIRSLKDDLAYIKERLEELTKTEAEDVNQAIIEIEGLKKKIKQLEQRVVALEQ